MLTTPNLEIGAATTNSGVKQAQPYVGIGQALKNAPTIQATMPSLSFLNSNVVTADSGTFSTPLQTSFDKKPVFKPHDHRQPVSNVASLGFTENPIQNVFNID